MDARRFRQAAELFEAARLLPPSKREAFLAARRGSDLQLRAQVMDLLREHDCAEGPLGANDFRQVADRLFEFL